MSDILFDMALKLFRKQEHLSLTVEEAEEFFRRFDIDIYDLGLPYLQGEEKDEFHDSRYHFKWFEKLKAEPVLDVEGNKVIRISGIYVTQPKDQYPAPECYRPIELYVPFKGE